MSSKPPFVHLRTHCHYSLLQALSKTDALVSCAHEHGMPALALTDYGNMYGAIEFYKECKSKNIKPIIGVELYLAPRSRHDRDQGIDDVVSTIILLAENITGYKNLMKLVSVAHMEGLFEKPRVDIETLQKYHEGLICLSGGPQGAIDHAITVNDIPRAKNLVKQFQDIFGTDNFFLEITKHDEIENMNALYSGVQKLSTETGAPMVATWNSHYLQEEDREAFRTLLQIDNHGDRGFRERFKDNRTNYSFISSEDAYAIFADVPEAITNTIKIADRINVEIDTKSWFFPDFPIDKGTTHDEMLRTETYKQLEKQGMHDNPEIIERIEFELKVISEKGYSSYFLCVADFFKAAKELNILGQTRGSAAGSLVAYLVGISNINPLPYGLLFERFLNPDRPSLPDIDMDFADNRRDEIITYARQKYGQHAVAQISTFGTMMARGSVRDVARALGFPYGMGDKISKMIPMGSQGFPMTIKRALKEEKELAELYETDRNTKEIIDMALKIEGNARHISVHAAGVVISPTQHVEDFSPVQFDPKGEGKIITQYDMYSGDREGIINLPKFDFLGLRNLTIMAEAIDRVKKIRGIEIDLEKIPLDDKKTYELFGRGESIGVFQFASSGMQKWLKELKPSNLEDLIAMASLYRPGPMAFIPDYIERKHNPKKIKYLDPRMEGILKNTYGIIVYQEDVMRMATDLAGYTRGESDKFRKAVGKKIPEEMAKQKDHFIEGCVENGMKPQAANELWEMIETFAAYGFNKSHSAVYALLAYRTAYMKAHYPAEYMTAILTCESDNMDTVTDMINESKRMGFEILPPDINESFSDFTVVVENGEVTNNIRFGLGSIKNLGENIGKAIIHERKQNGRFTSLENFLERVRHKDLNKKSLEALVMCGALDLFGERKQLIVNMADLLAYTKEIGKRHEAQTSLFGDMASDRAMLKLAPSEPATPKEKSEWEKELLGIYVTSHPLDQYRDKLANSKTNLTEIKNNARKGSTVTFGAVIENVKTIMTKKGERMAFVKFIDLTTTMEAVVFPKTFTEYKDILVEDQAVVVEVKINDRDGEKSMIVERLKVLQ